MPVSSASGPMSAILFAPRYQRLNQLQSFSGVRSLMSLFSRSNIRQALALFQALQVGDFLSFASMPEMFTTSASTSGSGLFRFSKTYCRTTASRFLSEKGRPPATCPCDTKTTAGRQQASGANHFIATPGKTKGERTGRERGG